MIYTSYFYKTKYFSCLYPLELCCISIAAKAPDYYKGIEYKKLAPSYDILMSYKQNQDVDIYTKRYYDEVLNNLDATNVIKDLERLSNDKTIVLLCYENPQNFCHRQLVAKWLAENGYKCEELNIGLKN